MANRRNRKLVPECGAALDQMKYEVASELGVPFGQNAGGLDAEFAGELGSVQAGFGGGSSYLGHLTAREAGSVGGEITKRLVRRAQQTQL
ncbi:alpha/beta-type small acid-soluble spore protein [Cohnella massiliensis]|uniref:alpha/beta-type small acid-soluble spore protein n=1 Tax=Cohnella massiliensis TaxID=1816691 RepID=UPI0009BB009E|nr:alpha/beta-type small acid-soluble spore protein [Cohnella massiliensis]